MTAPFLVAVFLLFVAWIFAGPLAGYWNIKQSKERLSLKRPLNALDPGLLAPYRVVNRVVLESVVEEALGTGDYVQWMLENPQLPPSDPLRFVQLFVTYYSGGHNLVPHTPDVCYLGAGYQPTQPHESIELDVPIAEVADGKLPVRVLTFGKTAVFDREEQSVVYTFNCNGRFVNTRTAVRVLINDLTNTYAYFSKIEISFPRATREQCIDGAAKLFARVVPVLLRDHFPDFEASERAARAVTEKG